jgi:hypothetical protein
MNEVNIIVEGPSERNFIKQVLAPYLAEHECYATPWVIGTPGHKGGDVKPERFINDLENALSQRTDTRISSMIDYFRLDSKWPGMDDLKKLQTNGRTLSTNEIEQVLCQRTKEDIENRFPSCNVSQRFIPYFSMHEFEALLFSDVSKLSQNLQIAEKPFRTILDLYTGNPEQINTDPSKAPSKRILSLYPAYKKVIQGKIIAESIGIPKMRDKCPCFNQWVRSLIR